MRAGTGYSMSRSAVKTLAAPLVVPVFMTAESRRIYSVIGGAFVGGSGVFEGCLDSVER